MPKLDFDKLREDKEDFDVTINGERIVFPKYVPADVVLGLRRKALKIPETDESAQAEFFIEMGRALMPADIFDRLQVALGLTELFDVIDELCFYYGIHERENPEGEESAGKTEPAQAPETSEQSGLRTSSSITVPSKPTSNVYGLVPTRSYDPDSSTGDASSAG